MLKLWLNNQRLIVTMKKYLIRLEEQGQITVPQSIQNDLQINKGDLLTLIQIEDLILLTAKQPCVPELIDKIVEISEEEQVSINELLEGLETEREKIYLDKI